MIQSGEVGERHTIPRWNNISVANALGETSSIREQPQKLTLIDNEVIHLESLLEKWKQEKNLPLAVEIISSSQIVGNNNTDVQDVRQYAIQKLSGMKSPPLLLREILGFNQELKEKQYTQTSLDVDSIRKAIKKSKKLLIQKPNNALEWCEIARNYLIIGQNTQCERALGIARVLAPNSRMILRATAQFYTHTGDIEKGLYYLRNSPSVRYDPWVLSSEIALSNELKRTSKFVKLGRQMIENTSINPASLSELASELGTMDFISDNRRSGRRKLEIAKIIPHENSIAQMIWIDQRVAPIGPIISNICSPKYNYEAEAKQFIAQEKWKEAVEIIRKWQSYQPFSKTPAMDGSYFAVDFLDDPRQAIQILDIGRVSNPHDPDITNNYIYSLIMNGDLEKASEQLRYQPVPSSLEADNLSLIATRGLWWYRKGCADIGKTFYELAIKQAHRLNQSDLEYRAMVYFAREEKRIGNDISHLRSILLNSKYREAYQSHLPLIKKFELLE